MSTDPKHQSRFLAECLREGIKDVFEAQERVGGNGHGEALRHALDSRRSMVQESGGGAVATLEHSLLLRFLDMRHLADLKVYNRPLWRTMYGKTRSRILYGFREWLQKNVGGALEMSD